MLEFLKTIVFPQQYGSTGNRNWHFEVPYYK